MKSKLTILNEIVSILACLIVVGTFCWGIFDQVFKGISIAFQTRIYNELNISERVKGEEEIKVSKPIKAAAEFIDYGKTFWVYLGSTPRGSEENWLTKYFNIATVPKTEDNIEAITDVFKRSDKPKIKEGEWTKGEIQGLVKGGQKFSVIEVAEIPGSQNRSLWWAKVSFQ